MSFAMFVLLGLTAIAAVPVAYCLTTRLIHGSRERLMVPAALTILGALFLFVGARHFGNGWPGTGGHHWANKGLVPGGLAAFSWASTLSVSSYWAHPSALGHFPTAELVWMAMSPVALVSVVIGVAKIVRRLELPEPVLRFEAKLATAAWAVMVVFLSGCCLWVVDGGSGPRNLFHAGAIDVIGIVMMICAVTTVQVAARRARLGAVDLVTD